jgi:small subunit ribosomal protein S20
MPNTKSAGRRMRNSARKQLQNRNVKTRLHNLERNFAELLSAGKKEEAGSALRLLSSAFDKAAKSGVVNRPMANRKKSRLSLRLNATKPA